MEQSPIISPTCVSLDKPYHVVSIESIYNAMSSEPFNPYCNNSSNNFGEAKCTCSGNFINSRDYNKYGMSSSLYSVLGQTYADFYAYIDPTMYSEAMHDTSYDAMVSADFDCETDMTGYTYAEEYSVGFINNIATAKCLAKVRYLMGSTMQVSIEIVGTAGGPVVPWGPGKVFPLSASHPACKMMSKKHRTINIALLWSKSLWNLGISSLYVFVNGYYACTVPAVHCRNLTDLGLCGAAAGVKMTKMAMDMLPDSICTFRNLRIRPVVLYGDGSARFPYERSWNNTYVDGPMFDCNSLYDATHGFSTNGLGERAIIRDQMSLQIKNIGHSGFYPITMFFPGTSGDIAEVVLENIMYNRKQNNPFDKKPPIIMSDHTLDIGENYNATGAVYESGNREMYPVPINQNLFDTSRNQPSSLFGFDNETLWMNMMNGSGDNGKVNVDGKWTMFGIKNFNENGAKLLTEDSYGGVVCEFSGLGDPSNLSGNGGWPIQCNRSPTDPLEFYADGIPPTCSILMENNIKHMRFVGLNAPDSDRLKALFVGIKMTAGGAAPPLYAMTADIVLGRLLNNDMVDISAPFGATGYRTLFTNEINQYLMIDLPQKLGTTAPVFLQYPDIAIVPIGDPRTTRKHRIYWLSGSTAGGVYQYNISYIDLDDNGETLVSASVQNITLNKNIYNPNTGGTIYNIPLQFDIIQPQDGKFVLTVTLGVSRAPNAAPSMETLAACAIYTSNDGINFNTPIPVMSGSFSNTPSGGKLGSNYKMSYGLPHLSYTSIGKNSGEILLCLTNLDCTTADNGEWLTTFVFKTSLPQLENWNIKYRGTPLSVFVDCKKLLSESSTNVSNWQRQNILGAAAFRDRQGKVHIAMNKKPRSLATPDDICGGIYYAVIDDSNYSNQISLSKGATNSPQGSNYNYYDVVSLNRLTWDNKAIDDNTISTYNGYSTTLRPYFSPTLNDCYFTYSVMAGVTYFTVTNARDPVYRLFQPTTLGEIYPPSASWNYAMQYPSLFYVGAPSLNYIWLRQPAAGAEPTMSSNGLLFANPTIRTKRFSFGFYNATMSWFQRLPREAVAIKTRFRYTGTNIGLPIQYAVLGSFTIKFENITMGTDPSTGNYRYLSQFYVSFNADSVAAGSNIAAPVFSSTGHDFSVFRDIYVILSLSQTNNMVYANIFMELVPNSNIDSRERWQPKMWKQLNESPIAVGVLAINAAMQNDRYFFGGHDGAGAAAIPAGESVECKFFQVYFPMFKAPDNRILQDAVTAPATPVKVDGLTSYTNCLVGGATSSLAARTQRYSWAQAKLCQGVFQIGKRVGTRNIIGSNAGQSREIYGGTNPLSSSANDFSPVGWSVGNNTILVVPDASNIEFNGERFTFPYIYKAGINNAKDFNPFTFWTCSDNTAPVRICFDSQKLINPRETFVANSLWLLNTNLINARIKANSVPSAWNAAPFNEAIDMSIDLGTVVTVSGSVASEDYIVIEDTTKNWISNQFVNNDSPYYIVHNSTAFIGGSIVKNTKTQIFYKPSYKVDGTIYGDFAAGDIFRIIAPSKLVKFDSKDYRYWAIEIMPNEVGDIQCYCDGVARIGEFGLGNSITLEHHGDIGFVENYKNILKTIGMMDGYERLDGLGRSYKEYDIKFTNCNDKDAYYILDVFKNSKTLAKPMWFALTEHNTNDIKLCDFIDSNIEESHSVDIDDEDKYFDITLKLRERI